MINKINSREGSFLPRGKIEENVSMLKKKISLKHKNIFMFLQIALIYNLRRANLQNSVFGRFICRNGWRTTMKKPSWGLGTFTGMLQSSYLSKKVVIWFPISNIEYADLLYTSNSIILNLWRGVTTSCFKRLKRSRKSKRKKDSAHFAWFQHLFESADRREREDWSRYFETMCDTVMMFLFAYRQLLGWMTRCSFITDTFTNIYINHTHTHCY